MNTRSTTLTPDEKRRLREVAKRRLAEIEQELDQARAEAGADVLAFYLACDPFLPNNLRCLAAPGAKYPEACSHFRLRPLATDEPRERFFPRAEEDPLRSGNDQRVQELIRTRHEPIFGDFVTREQIASRGRILERDPCSGQENALLTVNYRTAIDEAQWQSVVPRIASLFDRLPTPVALIQHDLRELTHDLCPSFLRMLDVTDPLQFEPRCSLPAQLRVILDQTIRTLGDDTARWCGTIHLLDESKRNLVLAASVGDFQRPAKTTHRIDAGEGVISWVALRKQAIRIRHLESSPFHQLHVEYLPGEQSQLAVPIMTHNRLLGTMSLEAAEPDLFCMHWTGYLTRVASLVATAVLHEDYEKVREERTWYRAAIYERECAKKDRPFESLSLADLDRLSAGPVAMLD